MNSSTIPPSSATEQISAPATSLEALTYSVGQTAQLFGVSHASIYRLVARGLLRPLPGFRHKRIPKRQVHEYANVGLPPL